jgi:hypothetical protein
VLAGRLHAAMKSAWETTTRHALDEVRFRSVELRLEPRDGPGWSEVDLTAKLTTGKPFDQCLAAMGLSWRKRMERPIQVPALQLGPAILLVLPGEAYVEYQLFAQQQRADAFSAGVGRIETHYDRVTNDEERHSGGCDPCPSRAFLQGCECLRILVDSPLHDTNVGPFPGEVPEKGFGRGTSRTASAREYLDPVCLL